MVINEDLDIPRDQNLDIRNPKKLKAFKDAGVNNPEWSSNEQRLQMFFDEIRGNDFHYRFSRTLRRLTKFYAEDGEEYLIILEDLKGVSPIGNDKKFTWEKGIVYIPKATFTSVPVNSESYKAEVSEISGGSPFYEIPFTPENVEDALKASPRYPKDQKWGVSFKIERYDSTISYTIDNFTVWRDYPVLELFDLCTSGRIKAIPSEETADKRKLEEGVLVAKLAGMQDDQIEQILKKTQEQKQREEDIKRSKK
jgi:hypothetical protein